MNCVRKLISYVCCKEFFINIIAEQNTFPVIYSSSKSTFGCGCIMLGNNHVFSNVYDVQWYISEYFTVTWDEWGVTEAYWLTTGSRLDIANDRHDKAVISCDRSTSRSYRGHCDTESTSLAPPKAAAVECWLWRTQPYVCGKLPNLWRLLFVPTCTWTSLYALV